ncbi:MAG: peptidoglycan-associated lipoprotein Pal [Arsenophonus sp. ER-QC15-MAG3]
MHLNKILKQLIVVLFILLITACNLKKNNEKNSYGSDLININDNLSTKQFFYNKKINRELQSNNIVYFGFDKSDIDIEYEDILNKQAIFLRENPSVNIIIEGHTDERGSPEYNIALGERRANIIKIYLQSKGVNSNQVSIVSYGKEKPAIYGHDESIFSKNRRAVIIY